MNISTIDVTPEVSHALMSSLKDEASSNNASMSVTPPVSHVEMWPYVAVAPVGFESHTPTATLIFQLTMTLPIPGRMLQLTPPTMPHHVDSHWAVSNASSRSTSLFRHQPRSWLNAVASLNMSCMSVTAPTFQLLIS